MVGRNVKVHFEDREFSIGTVDNCLVWSFRTTVTVERVQRARPIHLELKRSYPKFGVMTIVAETVSLAMPQDARELSTAITKEFHPYYCGVCEVIEGRGFGASVARSVVAGIKLIARSTAPGRVLSDVTSGGMWLGALCDPANPEAMGKRLVDAAQRLRTFTP